MGIFRLWEFLLWEFLLWEFLLWEFLLEREKYSNASKELQTRVKVEADALCEVESRMPVIYGTK